MLIDFEKKFAEYLQDYMQRNDIDEEEIDERAPDIYLDWLDTPAEWLSGCSPNGYFAAMDAAELTASLGRYVLAGVTVPGALLNSIADKAEETYPLLLAMMRNYEGEKSDEIKTAVVRLIEEMDMPRPYGFYIETVAAAEEKSSFCEACVEELRDAGEDYKESMIAAYENARSPYSADCFLDILSDMPFDERVFEYALERFLYGTSGRAFYASCLGKLGCEKALPYLEEALRQEGLSYYDYVSIRNAVEELGGEIEIERDFSGDKDYDALINTED